MIHPAYLMDVLESLEEGEIPNQVIVEPEVQEGAKNPLKGCFQSSNNLNSSPSSICKNRTKQHR